MKIRTQVNYIDDVQNLTRILPQLKKLQGEIIVFKYGGAAMVQDDLKMPFVEDIVLLKELGVFPVIVHGGGPEISREMKVHGLEANFIDGLRVTDLASLKITERVLSGSVNKEIVANLQKAGGQAVGVSGKDGKLIQGKKLIHPKGDLGFVGEIEEINPNLIFSLLEADYIPVISPIGIGNDGTTYNINADTAASRIGVALKAQKMIFLTDVDGILKDDEQIAEITIQEAKDLIADETISGGMVPKVEGMLYSLDNGVESVHIINGMKAHLLLSELFNLEGVGTKILHG
ncbi:MAG: acetylglutamate kinase [bacterium]|jgi:acetylglutamate kinase